MIKPSKFGNYVIWQKRSRSRAASGKHSMGNTSLLQDIHCQICHKHLARFVRKRICMHNWIFLFVRNYLSCRAQTWVQLDSAPLISFKFKDCSQITSQLRQCTIQFRQSLTLLCPIYLKWCMQKVENEDANITCTT